MGKTLIIVVLFVLVFGAAPYIASEMGVDVPIITDVLDALTVGFQALVTIPIQIAMWLSGLV